MTNESESVRGGTGGGVPRRRFLQAAGLATGAVAAVGGVASAASAAGGGKAPGKGGSAKYVLPEGYAGTLADLKHVVILMQENRSFDHYLGQLPGVRGHKDKQALKFQDGTDVFSQRAADGTIVLPYAATSNWGDDHSFYGANGGRWNTWVPDKGSNCMGYYDPSYMPFYYSMAAQYTVCDQNFCAEHGPTDPNRKYFWSGSANRETENSDESNYSRTWLTVPEQLQQVGIDWRLYSDNSGNGRAGYLSSNIGDYGDNELKYFKAYDPNGLSADDPRLAPGTGLIWRANATYYAGSTTPNDSSDANLNAVLRDFIAACQPGAQYPLPAVSWLVAPYAWSEHPSADTEHGERYVQKVIDTLQGNPDIWNHTLFIITYDENDGKFDHVLPPRPEPGTANEFSGSTPLGLGPRVPMMLVSPWSRGGYVASEVFDHTSVTKFLETWAAYLGKPFVCPNITPWRRSIVGDLTSALDFAHPRLGPVDLADPDTGTPPPLSADNMKRRTSSFHGHATLVEDRIGGTVTARMTLAGGPAGKALSMQVFPDKYQAFSNTPFTVTAANPRQYVWDVKNTDGRYAFSIYGNDGFVRSFAGQVVPAGQKDTGIPRVDVDLVAGSDARVKITLRNDGTHPVRYMLTANDYLGGVQVFHVTGGKSEVVTWPTEEGYYDVVITADTGTGWTQRYAGRVATA
ncbi:alkaline phosphatase family protein [Rugosimonospora acidiphila]